MNILDTFFKSKKAATLSPKVVTLSPTEQHYQDLDSGSCPNEFGIDFFGETTPAFRRGIIDVYRELRPSVKGIFRDYNVKVHVGGIFDDVDPKNARKLLNPSIDDTRINQNQITGSSGFGEGLIRLTEHKYIGRNASGPINKPGIENKNEWRIVDITMTGNTFRHEVGHMYSDILYYIYDLPDFIEQYNKDVAALGGVNEARNKGWGYEVRLDDVSLGRSELFANIWAELNGGSNWGPEVLETFPNSARWVQQLQRTVEAAYSFCGIYSVIYDIRHPIGTMKWGGAPVSEETASSRVSAARERLLASGSERLLKQFDELAHIIENMQTPLRHNLRATLADATIIDATINDAVIADDEKRPGCELILSLLRQFGQIPDSELARKILDFSKALTDFSDDLIMKDVIKDVSRLNNPELDRCASALAALPVPELKNDLYFPSTRRLIIFQIDDLIERFRKCKPDAFASLEKDNNESVRKTMRLSFKPSPQTDHLAERFKDFNENLLIYQKCACPTVPASSPTNAGAQTAGITL